MSHVFKQAEFVRAITNPDQAPPERPAVAFAGRSNVGKSSLINSLLHRKGLARTSNTPGRTREVHYYSIEDTYYFVDLPGYGYAKVPQAVRKMWGPMIERFFKRAQGIRLVILIVDARRTPSPEDFQMLNWLEASDHPYLFAVTKTDKLTRGQLAKSLATLQQAFGLPDASALAPVSSKTGAGIDDLRRLIRATLEQPAEKPDAPEPGDSPAFPGVS